MHDIISSDMPKRKMHSSVQDIKNISVKNRHLRSSSETFADVCTRWFGTSKFLFFHALFFAVWIVGNLGFFSGITPIDPYPFNFLTTVVSLEAILLSIAVLMSQNRAERIANIRDEVDLQITVQSEKEITKMLKMLSAIEERVHVPQKADPELLAMLRNIDLDRLEERVAKVIERKM